MSDELKKAMDGNHNEQTWRDAANAKGQSELPAPSGSACLCGSLYAVFITDNGQFSSPVEISRLTPRELRSARCCECNKAITPSAKLTDPAP